jgi:transcription initiation factor TFIIH subunit 2
MDHHHRSLTTTDPGDIFATTAALQRDSIRCSFIGIGAEMHLLRRIAKVCLQNHILNQNADERINQDTKGTYYVAKDESHFKELLSAFTVPCPNLSSSMTRFASLVEVPRS